MYRLFRRKKGEKPRDERRLQGRFVVYSRVDVLNIRIMNTQHYMAMCSAMKRAILRPPAALGSTLCS